GAKYEEMPWLRRLRHQRHDDYTTEERALNQELVAEAIADPAPERCTERDDGRSDAESDSGPESDFASVGDAEFLDVPGEKWHHQREAGEAHEGRGDDRDLIPPPAWSV